MAIANTGLLIEDGTITIQDGAALTYTIIFEDGDLQINGLRRNQAAIVVGKDRGRNAWFREGEDQDFDISFSCQAVALLGDGTTATPNDVFLRKGVWAAAVSTLPLTTGDVYALKLTFTGERSNFGATSDTTVVAKYVTWEVSFSEGVPGKLSFKGTGHVYSNDYLTITG